MKQMSFHCKANNETSILLLSKSKLTITNDTFSFQFELALNQLIIWLLQYEQLIGFQIDDLIILADSTNLKCLKRSLGGYVTYSGIKYFYKFKETLSFNSNGETKVCSLVKNSNKETYACKCFKKKKGRSLSLIHQEIRLLMTLQNESFVPIIYEVYESRNCIYLIMELLQEELDYELLEDRMKLVIYKLLQIVECLQDLEVAHKTITRSHIMFDEENNVKLVGFSQSKCLQVSNYEFELDIFKIASILYKYYQKQNKEKQLDVPLLQNLLNKQYLYRFNIGMALSDPFFNPVRTDGIQIEIKSMNPKFKKKIEQDHENFSSLSQVEV